MTYLKNLAIIWQGSTPVHEKNNGNRMNFPQYCESYLLQTPCKSYTKLGKLKILSSDIWHKTKLPSLTIYIQYSIGSTCHSN